MRPALFAVLAMVLSACDLTVGTLEVRLVTSPIPGENPLGGDVERVRVRVEAGTDGVFVEEHAFQPGGRAKLLGVPVGRGRVVEVQGLTSGGREVSRGRSLPIVVEDGTHAVDLYVAEVGRFSSSAPPADPAVPGTPRGAHDAVPLGDGRILLVGGSASLELRAGGGPSDPPRIVLGPPLAEIDIFDPTSGRLAEGAGSCPEPVVSEPLCARTARLDAAVGTSMGGDVLIAGGVDEEGNGASQVERFASHRLWSEVVGGSMQGRRGASFVPTPAGALLVGGLAGPALDEPTGTALRLDPGGVPSAPFDLLECRRGGHETLLAGGLVLLFGGRDGEGLREDFEVLAVDPLASLGCAPLPEGIDAREGASVAVVNEQVALLVGGRLQNGDLSGEVDVFDARTRTFCPVGHLREPRYLHAAAALPDESVLIVGGLRALGPGILSVHPGSTLIELDFVLALLDTAAAGGEPLSCSTLEDQMVERAGPTPDHARVAPTATALPNGMVLLAGGFAGEEDSAELRPVVGSGTFELLVP